MGRGGEAPPLQRPKASGMTLGNCPKVVPRGKGWSALPCPQSLPLGGKVAGGRTDGAFLPRHATGRDPSGL